MNLPFLFAALAAASEGNLEARQRAAQVRVAMLMGDWSFLESLTPLEVGRVLAGLAAWVNAKDEIERARGLVKALRFVWHHPHLLPPKKSFPKAVWILWSDRLSDHVRDMQNWVQNHGVPDFPKTGDELGPQNSHRAAACAQGSGSSLYYAFRIDQGPHDLTREAVIAGGIQHFIARYACEVDKGPRDDTRAAVLLVYSPGHGDASSAAFYARYADRGPREDTRAAACREPRSAVFYARWVDKGPRDDTRQAALRLDTSAFEYARYVDRCARPDTWAAIQNLSKPDLAQARMEWYTEHLGTPEHPKKKRRS